MPLYGIQIPIALCLALLLRANLPILVGLQMLSNPLTILPFWYAAYQVGSSVLHIVSVDTPPLGQNDVKAIVHNFTNGEWSSNIEPLLATFSIMCLGGIVLGVFFGLISSFSYRFAAKRTAASYARLIHKIHDRKARKSDPPLDSNLDA